MTNDWGPPPVQQQAPHDTGYLPAPHDTGYYPAPHETGYHPVPRSPAPYYPGQAVPYPQQGWPQPVPAPSRGGRRCAVLAPVLLVLSVVPALLAPFLGFIGVFAAATPEEDGGGGGLLALAVVLGILGVGLWFASVVTSIVGVAMARGGYRITAGVTLGFAVGTVPVLLVLSSLLG